MASGIFRVRSPENQPVRSYAPGSAERDSLVAELNKQADEVVEIPCVVGGEHIYTDKVVEITMPCDHGHTLARLHLATPEVVERSVNMANAARAEWAGLPWEQRASVMLRCAALLEGPWRDRVNAATMLGQAKTVHQAEIDAACELIDFWRFNAKYAEDIYSEQPPISPAGVWNRVEQRPLDGFVFAVTPFNFSSIAANLPTAPALMGNTIVWKPATTSALSCWNLFQLMEEAGFPPGVINMVHGHGADVGGPVVDQPSLAGIHFTGSTATFQHLYKTVGSQIERYNTYPRLVGETGGKDFIIAHPSADPTAVAVAIARGCFEYQGQKCSAPSRIYLPKCLWPSIREQVVAIMGEFKQGDVRDFSNFVAAVIDERAFQKHESYLALGHESATCIAGGKADRSVGWYVEPTLFEVTDPKHRLMQEEIFGPIGTVFVYDDADYEQALQLVDSTSPYALTGGIFARDRMAINRAIEALRHAAGNFYINDKPTGAVVGQQPFGGSRASGTNDKAGSPLNLQRWVSARTIKETFVSPTEWSYPFLG